MSQEEDFFVDHLPAHIPENFRKALLRASFSTNQLLFDQATVSALFASTRDSMNFKSQQAMIDSASRSSSGYYSRGSGQSPGYRRRHSRSRSRSPAKSLLSE